MITGRIRRGPIPVPAGSVCRRSGSISVEAAAGPSRSSTEPGRLPSSMPPGKPLWWSGELVRPGHHCRCGPRLTQCARGSCGMHAPERCVPEASGGKTSVTLPGIAAAELSAAQAFA